MADFFPGTEKSDSSQLNTDTRNAERRNAETRNTGTQNAETQSLSLNPGEKEISPAAGEKDHDAVSKEVANGENLSAEKRDFSGRTGVDSPASVSVAGNVDDGASGIGSSAEERNSTSAKAAASGKSAPAGKPVPGDKSATAGKSVPAEAKKADNAKTASYREKILRHKKRRYRRTIILVILVMALLTTGVILWMRRGYRRAELIRIATLVADDSASYENLGGNVVQYGSRGAVCIDQRGNTLWDVSYEMQQPITSVSGNVIAIANRSGYYVYVMNTQGLMGTIHTTLPIHSIAAAENGEVAVIMDGTNATWVRLYTADGREIAYLVRTMAENGYPIAAAVSPDGETLCLSSVSMSNAAVKSNISFYNFGKTGQKMSDHLVEHADSVDVVVPYLHYMDNTTCICVSDKQLICYWRNIFRPSGSHYAELNDNILGVFCGDSFIGTLSTNTKGESQYTLDLYNKRGKKAGSVNFTMQYTNIAIGGDKIYIHNEQECQIYTIGGHCLFNGTFDKSIRALIPGAGLSDLLVVTAGEVDSVRLH